MARETEGLSLKAEHQRFFTLPRETLADLCEAEVERLRLMAQAHWTKRHAVAFRVAISAVVAVAAGLIAVNVPALNPLHQEIAPLQTGMRLFLIAAFSLVAGTFLDILARDAAGADEREELERALTPLRLHPEWESHVRQCLDVAECRAYRDRVVQGGRTLLRRDLGEMERIVEEVMEKRYDTLLQGVQG